MRSADNIKKLIKNTKIKTNPEVNKAVLDDLENQLDHAQGKQMNAIRQNIWRIIMKTKTAKLAAAAIFLVVAFLSLTVWNTTVSPAYALEQAFDAMDNTNWMHILAKQKDLQREYWISFPQKTIASKNSSGEISYQKDRMCYSYDMNDKAVIIYLSSGDAFEFLGQSPLGFIDHLKKMIKETEGEITREATEYFDKKAFVYKMNSIIDGKDMSLEITVDAEKNYPLSMKMSHTGNENEPPIESELHFDYPSVGPEDIYALGVALETQVIDNRPVHEVSNILYSYETHRNNFTSSYIAIVTQTFWFDQKLNNSMPRQVDVIYQNENKQRVDSYGVPSENKTDYKQNWSKYKSEMGNSIDSLYQWWTSSELVILAQANLYDGKFYHQRRRDNNDQWTSLPKIYSPLRNDNRADDDIADMGWTVYLTNYSTPSTDVAPLVVIENDYTKSNNLICLETKTQGNIITDSKDKVWAVAPSRKAYYLNPKRDYICQRIEQEERFDAPWQEDKDLIKRVEQEGINKNPTVNSVREVTEYGRTEQGAWYPTVIKSWEPNRADRSLRVKRIYLNSNPVFPDNIFNPKALPK